MLRISFLLQLFHSSKSVSLKKVQKKKKLKTEFSESFRRPSNQSQSPRSPTTTMPPPSSPPPPPQPPDYSLNVLSTLDRDFLNLAGLSAFAMMIVYFIYTCYERKYWNRSRDIEGGVQRRTVAQPPAEAAAGSSRGDRRPTSTAVISTRLFQYGERGVEGKNADCSICLDEFTEGEVCRMLPKCKHVFHRFCIDQWLPSERHCPVCRSPVHVRIVYPRPSWDFFFSFFCS